MKLFILLLGLLLTVSNVAQAATVGYLDVPIYDQTRSGISLPDPDGKFFDVF